MVLYFAYIVYEINKIFGAFMILYAVLLWKKAVKYETSRWHYRWLNVVEEIRHHAMF